jgi:hypothetical protein
VVWWRLIAQPGLVPGAAHLLFVGEPLEFRLRDMCARETFRHGGWSRWRFGAHEAIVSAFARTIADLVLIPANRYCALSIGGCVWRWPGLLLAWEGRQAISDVLQTTLDALQITFDALQTGERILETRLEVIQA